MFELEPGQPARVVVQPWGDQHEIGSEPCSGSEPRSIKVWGRRRLRVLRELLPLATELTVRLVDSGMPSFWSIELEGISLHDRALLDRSGLGRQSTLFSAFTPAERSDEEAIEQTAELLQRQHCPSVDGLAQTPEQEPWGSPWSSAAAVHRWFSHA